MNKQTKLYLGIGLVLVAGYLVYKNMTKTNPSTTTEGDTASFVGKKRKRKANGNGGSYQMPIEEVNTYGDSPESPRIPKYQIKNIPDTQGGSYGSMNPPIFEA